MIAYKHQLSFLLLVSCALTMQASKLVTGDTSGSVSFSFPILTHVYDATNDLFFVGSNQDAAGANYSVAVGSAAQNFQPLTPEFINQNGIINSSNPLYNKKISQLAVVRDVGVAAVADDDSPTLHLIYNFLNASNAQTARAIPQVNTALLLSATTINDAESNKNGGIVGVAASNAYFYAAVKKNGGTFGEVGGGIALLNKGLGTINAVTGTDGNLAVPLDPTAGAVKITNDLASITADTVDMYYDSQLQRTYIALQVTAAGGGSDGARAIVSGRVLNNILYLDPIAPDAVFAGTNKIVGATGASETVTMIKVRTLHTSSRLSYLIVEGDVGTNVGRNIYALPLVDNRALPNATNFTAAGDPAHGTLAKFDSEPTTKFYETDIQEQDRYPHRFAARGFTTQATASSDVLTNTDTAALVGGGPLALATTQTITDMFAQNDAVYVSIADTFDGTTTPGVFYSQAILDQFGRIKAWTAWQRAAGTDDKIFGMGMDERTGNMWLMPGDSATTVDTVNLTVWSNATGDGLLGGLAVNSSVGLVNQVTIELTEEQGGIHNLFNFSQLTPGFGSVTTTIDNQISMAVMTGLRKIVLVETGRNATASQFRANTGDFSTGKQTFTDGTLTGFVDDGTPKILSLSGGVLNQLGPITSAEVSRTPLSGSTENGYLFVGGTFGLAVLSKSDDAGWDTSSPNGGLHAGFSGLTADMSFKLLGSYSNVRKLVCDGTYLYVLTNTILDRISLASIASGPLVTVRLATLYQLGLPDYASLSDVVISQKLGLLATSAGLYRVANGYNIADAALASDGLGWKNVPLQEGLPVTTRFMPVSPNNFDSGLATGGMLYVLGGSVTLKEARVYRFSVADVSSSAIDDDTVLPLNDIFIKNVPSFFMEFGSYRNFISSEGNSLLNVMSGNQVNGPLLLNVAPIQTGNPYVARNFNWLFSTLPSSSTSSVRRLLRNTASGGWLVGTGAGLLVNE
jgi:hypothetical protein